MGVQTLLGSAKSDGFRFNFAPLLPIALSVFCLSGLGFYHVALSGTGGSDSLFQGLVVGLYKTLGFVPSFMLFLMVLSWSSIWFISGSLTDPAGRLGRLLLLTLSLAVLVNLQPEVGPAAPHSGAVGHFLAVRLQSIFGYTISTLLVAPLALVTLLLATDFFFYRYFETLGDKRVPEPSRARHEAGVEAEATETLKSLRFSGLPGEAAGGGTLVSPEPVDLVVADETAVRQTSRSRLVVDVDEEIFWEPPAGGEATAVMDPPEEGVVTEEALETEDTAVAEPEVEEAEAEEEEAEEVEESEEADEEYDEEGEYEEEEEEGEYEEEEDSDADEEYEEEEYEEGEEDADEEYEEEEEDEDAEYEGEEGDEEDEEYEEEDDEEYEEKDDEGDVDLSLEEPAEEAEVEEEPERSRDPEPVVIRLDRDPAEQPEITDLDEPVVLFLDGEDEALALADERAAESKVVEIPRSESGAGLVQEARELVVNTGRVSASFLQRRLRVDYQEAVGLLRVLKGQGVIEIGEGEAHGRLV